MSLGKANPKDIECVQKTFIWVLGDEGNKC